MASHCILPLGGAVVAPLILGWLDKETSFVEFDEDCDAYLILSYNLL